MVSAYCFGAAAFSGGLPFVTLSQAAAKSATFSTGRGSPALGIVACFSSLPGCGAPFLDGAGVPLSLASLPAGADCSAVGDATTLDASSTTGDPTLTGAGWSYTGRNSFAGSTSPGSGVLSTFPASEYSFLRQPPKSLLCCEIEKASSMAGLWGETSPFSLWYMKAPPVVPLGGSHLWATSPLTATSICLGTLREMSLSSSIYSPA